jgi:hypothetical protein
MKNEISKELLLYNLLPFLLENSTGTVTVFITDTDHAERTKQDARSKKNEGKNTMSKASTVMRNAA